MTSIRNRPECHNTSDGTVRVRLFHDLWPGSGDCDDEMRDADPTPLTSPELKKKKVRLTPELRQLPTDFIKRRYPSGGSVGLLNSDGYEYLRRDNSNKLRPADTLEETMELISESITVDRNRFSDLVDELKCQVVQLEEENYRKTAKIENLQLYNSDKLKIINSLIVALKETQWKRDTMQQICQEHAPNKLYKSMMLVSRVLDKMPVFYTHRETLRSCANNLDVNDTLRQVVRQLVSDLDECIGVIERAANRDFSDALMDEKHFNDTVKNIFYDFRNSQSSAAENDGVRGPRQNAMAVTDHNGTGAGGKVNNNLEKLIELWALANDLSQSNQYLANRVASMNMHKTSLQYQLDEMENSTKELELKTITETEQIEKKQDILDKNESMIQQRWDELNTSQELVIQTHRSQEIDQELEDLQTEYDNHDKENRQLKTDLNYLRNELTEYRIKCEQLEKETKLIETEKNEILEEYAKSWGHHNTKQKIKYTGRLIKDMNSINQEINWLETEIKKQERGVVSCNNFAAGSRTPVFNKTQPRSVKTPKTPKTYDVIESSKRQNLSVFRENAVCKLRYHQ